MDRLELIIEKESISSDSFSDFVDKVSKFYYSIEPERRSSVSKTIYHSIKDKQILHQLYKKGVQFNKTQVASIYLSIAKDYIKDYYPFILYTAFAVSTLFV